MAYVITCNRLCSKKGICNSPQFFSLFSPILAKTLAKSVFERTEKKRTNMGHHECVILVAESIAGDYKATQRSGEKLQIKNLNEFGIFLINFD